MRFVTLGEKHYFGFDNIMQKSVLVPFEKYQRLLERSTTPNKDTVEAATETECLPEPPVEERLTEPLVEERLTEPPVEEKTELPVTPIEEKAVSTVEGESHSEPTIQVGQNLEISKPLKKKRQRRSGPPGIKDYKSMWIKLNGRL